MSGGRWSAALLGAALLDREGNARHCQCAHGTCQRCLVRLRVIAPDSLARIDAHAAALDLDAALDSEAGARLDGDELTTETHRAAARAALDLLGSHGGGS